MAMWPNDNVAETNLAEKSPTRRKIDVGRKCIWSKNQSSQSRMQYGRMNTQYSRLDIFKESGHPDIFINPDIFKKSGYPDIFKKSGYPDFSNNLNIIFINLDNLKNLDILDIFINRLVVGGGGGGGAVRPSADFLVGVRLHANFGFPPAFKCSGHLPPSRECPRPHVQS